MNRCLCHDDADEVEPRKIRFTRGDSYTLNVTYESVSAPTYPWTPPVFTPIVITGAAIYFTCKQYKDDPDPGFFQLIVGAGVTIINGALGQFQIVIPQTATSALAYGVSMPYDCVIELVAGGRDTVLEGGITLRQSVTDA